MHTAYIPQRYQTFRIETIEMNEVEIGGMKEQK